MIHPFRLSAGIALLLSTTLWTLAALEAPRQTVAAAFYPGIYPALTPGYAASLQMSVRHGHKRWLTNAGSVALAFARFIRWPADARSIHVPARSGTRLTVRLARQGVPGQVLSVQEELLGPVGTIWAVTGCTSSNLSLAAPVAGTVIHSVVRARGTIAAFEGDFTVSVLDTRWRSIATSHPHTLGQSRVPFTGIVVLPRRTGYGIVEVSTQSPKDGSLLDVAMTKIVLRPTS